MRRVRQTVSSLQLVVMSPLYGIGTGEVVTQQPEADITAYMCCPPGVPASLMASEPEGQPSLQTHVATVSLDQVRTGVTCTMQVVCFMLYNSNCIPTQY